MSLLEEAPRRITEKRLVMGSLVTASLPLSDSPSSELIDDFFLQLTKSFREKGLLIDDYRGKGKGVRELAHSPDFIKGYLTALKWWQALTSYEGISDNEKSALNSITLDQWEGFTFGSFHAAIETGEMKLTDLEGFDSASGPDAMVYAAFRTGMRPMYIKGLHDLHTDELYLKGEFGHVRFVIVGDRTRELFMKMAPDSEVTKGYLESKLNHESLVNGNN